MMLIPNLNVQLLSTVTKWFSEMIHRNNVYHVRLGMTDNQSDLLIKACLFERSNKIWFTNISLFGVPSFLWRYSFSCRRHSQQQLSETLPKRAIFFKMCSDNFALKSGIIMLSTVSGFETSQGGDSIFQALTVLNKMPEQALGVRMSKITWVLIGWMQITLQSRDWSSYNCLHALLMWLVHSMQIPCLIKSIKMEKVTKSSLWLTSLHLFDQPNNQFIRRRFKNVSGGT